MASVPSSLQLPDSVRATLLRLHERHGRHLPTAAVVLFVVLIALVLGDLFWAVMPLPKAAIWQPAPAVPADYGTRVTGAVDLAAIQSAHVFGEYKVEQTPNALAAAPETQLNLKLLGVFASDNERTSRALIELQAGDERPFGIGAQVTQGTSLQAIFPDRVVLSRAGKLETLRLDKDRASDNTPSAPMARALDGNPTLVQIRDQVLQDPTKASDYVRVQPANQDGRLHGYRIYPGQDRTVFSQAGLRPGDLVTQVNGVQLDDASKALKMLSELRDQSQLNLVVERGGQTQTINVNLN